MTERYDWTNAEDPQDIIHQVVQRLYEGQIVLFPTSATYVLAAYADTAGIPCRLRKATMSDNRMPLWGSMIPRVSWNMPSEWGAWSTADRKGIARPSLILLEPAEDPDLLAAEARELVTHAGKFSVRVPAHEAIIETLRLLPEPLVLVDGAMTASTAEGAAQAYGGLADVLLDDGPTPFGKLPTVVDVTEEYVKVLREGVIPASRVKRLTSEIITFVCTGNSCRSPLAEAIFRKMLADSLGTGVEQLADRGFIVQSGLAAYDGAPAAAHAQEIVQEYGTSLEDHAAQTLTPKMIQFSDRILVMTREHRAAILGMGPKRPGRRPCSEGEQISPIRSEEVSTNIVDVRATSRRNYNRSSTT